MAQVAAAGSWWRDPDHASPARGSIPSAHIKGTPGSDRIHGTAGDDTIGGRGGDDVLGGRYGYDHLSGGAGNDVLRGGTERQEAGQVGRDILDGGAGDDHLFGGFESDGLTGGNGKDRFTYMEVSDATVEHPDTITDFTQGDDKLVFRGVFRESGDLHFIGDAEFSMTPGEVRYEAFAGADQAIVDVDLDGDGSTDTRIVFWSDIHFQTSDFSF